MNTDFVFLHNLRGVYLNTRIRQIYINLSAEQWKDLSEEEVISNISETIVHENLHWLISEINPERTDEGEEKVCKYLAGQDLDFNFKGLKLTPKAETKHL